MVAAMLLVSNIVHLNPLKSLKEDLKWILMDESLF